MTPLDLLRHLPLASASVFWIIVAFQIYRQRTRTWTETFFLCGLFFFGLYAFCDWLLFNVALPETAPSVVFLDLTALTLSVLYFTVFSRVFLDKFRPLDVVFFLPTVFALALIPTSLVRSVVSVPVPGGPPLFLVEYNHPYFELWVLYVLVYLLYGVRNLHRMSRVVQEQSASLGRKTRGLVVSFLLAILLGFFTNGLIEILEIQAFPAFSSAMVLPGLATAFLLAPGAGVRVSQIVMDWKRRHKTMVRAAYLIFEDGTLIEQHGNLEGKVDDDVFIATLDVISHFMRTSFPHLRGHFLKAIDHGDMRIIIERGKYAYLALVIEGEDDDLLRRQMRDEIGDFERKNEATLRAWKGLTEDARGAQEMLGRFFSPAVLF